MGEERGHPKPRGNRGCGVIRLSWSLLCDSFCHTHSALSTSSWALTTPQNRGCKWNRPLSILSQQRREGLGTLADFPVPVPVPDTQSWPPMPALQHSTISGCNSITSLTCIYFWSLFLFWAGRTGFLYSKVYNIYFLK